MYDFSVFYADFKQNLSIDEFCEKLEKIGGYTQSYDVNMYLDGTLIDQESFDSLSLDEMCRVTYMPVDPDMIEVVFYNYCGFEASAFFNKYGVDHDAILLHQIRIQKEFRVCMSKFF